MLNRIFAFLMSLSLALWVPAALASSPAEPAFKSQLASCFEANRPTEAIRDLQSWQSAGKSVFSSYQLAVSISTNCMRSVCAMGTGNSLCCNTYASTYGLTGSARDTMANRCMRG